jgi:DCN1-like protein 1/2
LKDRQLASLIDLTKEEFIEGMKRVGVETVADLKAKMPKVREDVDAKDFKAFHRFVFEVNAAGPPAVRTLEAETVARFARTCLHRSRFSLLDELLAFLEATPKRAVTKDAWIQLLPFGDAFKNKDLSAYDDNAAWPVSNLLTAKRACDDNPSLSCPTHPQTNHQQRLIDEFVIYCRGGASAPPEK